MPHSLELEPFLQLSAHELLTTIARHPKILLADLHILDLLFDGKTELWHGVYLFYSDTNVCLYAGKNSAQTFVERIPWHFAPNEESWMNHFLKRYRASNGLMNLAEAARACMDSRLLLINVGTHDPIARLEKFCRIFLKPVYNTFSQSYLSRYARTDLAAPLASVLVAL